MNILVGCEFSGIVRNAFTKAGHYAISCDYLDTELPGPHYTGNLEDIVGEGWDMLIVHPTCTRICVSGNSRWAGTPEREADLDFVRWLLNLPIPRICLENPVGVISSQIRKPDQYIQPWMFGHGETKKTGLWLKNLPTLKPTNIVPGREERVHSLRDGHARYPTEKWRQRTRFWPGVAEAMANQWGNL